MKFFCLLYWCRCLTFLSQKQLKYTMFCCQFVANLLYSFCNKGDIMTQEEKQEIINAVLQELNKPVDLPVEIAKDQTAPFYAHPGDAGMDLRCNADVELAPGETKILPTGFKTAIPSGYMIEIRPRSGLNAKTPLRVYFSPIDEGYRGEYGVIMTNHSPLDTADQHWTIDDKGKFGTFHIRKGDRIAQIVMSRYATMNFIPVDDITTIEGNRGGGFGSSGTK